MRLKSIILWTLTVIVAGVCFVYFSEYSYNEISADNFEKKLQVVYSESIFRGKNIIFIEDPWILTEANTKTTDERYTFSKYSSTTDDVVEINDKKLRDCWYTVLYNKKYNTPYQFSVTEWKINGRKVYLPMVIKALLEEGEFSLKKTELIKGNADILIKDIGDYFLIGRVGGGIQNPMSLDFKLFSKRKFFKSLHQ